MAYRGGTAGPMTLIDRDSYFSGTFRSTSDIRVDGHVEGEIHCEGTLTVSDSARVAGTVEAANISVAGLLEGQVTCAERFEILSTGQVSAHVAAGSIVVHEGGFYEGEMRMHEEPAGLPARELAPLMPLPTSQNGRATEEAPTMPAGTEG